MAANGRDRVIQDVLPIHRINIWGPKVAIPGKVDARAVGEHGTNTRPWSQQGGRGEDANIVVGGKHEVLLAVAIVVYGRVPHHDIACSSSVSSLKAWKIMGNALLPGSGFGVWLSANVTREKIETRRNNFMI